MRIAHALSTLTFGASLLVGGAPVAHASKVALLGEVEVHGSSVFLSDLMPVEVSAAVRKGAQTVLIGSAPPPGTDRVFEGARVAGLLGSDLAAEISIPQEIVVHRVGRLISRDEVVAAIRSALGHGGFSGTDLEPDDIRIFPSVMASSDHTDLHVRRMDFDDHLKEGRFLMAERGTLPFLVTAQMRGSLMAMVASRETSLPHSSESGNIHADSQAADSHAASPQSRLEELLGQRSLRDSDPEALLNAAQVESVVLVEPRTRATLYLNSSGMQMLLDVTPLEKGALNQTIRVKLPVTGKVLYARVIGARRLSATF